MAAHQRLLGTGPGLAHAAVLAVRQLFPGVLGIVQIRHQAFIDDPLPQLASFTGQASSMRRNMLRLIQSALDR